MVGHAALLTKEEGDARPARSQHLEEPEWRIDH
jgi:hypothetical protein